jgi:hypothetical protein
MLPAVAASARNVGWMAVDRTWRSADRRWLVDQVVDEPGVAYRVWDRSVLGRG